MPLSLINPWVILSLVLALAGVYGVGHHKGYVERDLEMQAEIARMNEEARGKERAMQAAANANASHLRKANQDAQDQIARLNADIGTGAVRLSIAAGGLQGCRAAGVTAGDSAEARAELDPTTARDLVAIAADGDAAIRQLNACIDTYNAIRSKQ